jgi:hypothetical protein
MKFNTCFSAEYHEGRKRRRAGAHSMHIARVARAMSMSPHAAAQIESQHSNNFASGIILVCLDSNQDRNSAPM